MIRNLSETVIVPIAGIILTFVMCYELIQLIIEKNNLHDFDTWIFFKWIFKTFCAVLIVTNTWNIVMAVFDVAQNVVSQSAGVIISDAGDVYKRQEVKHYPEKRGIVHKEILLPANAPRSYADRNTLWNAAEAVEKQWNSQLARRWDSYSYLVSFTGKKP